MSMIIGKMMMLFVKAERKSNSKFIKYLNLFLDSFFRGTMYRCLFRGGNDNYNYHFNFFAWLMLTMKKMVTRVVMHGNHTNFSTLDGLNWDPTSTTDGIYWYVL